MPVPHSEQAELYPQSNSMQQAKLHGTKLRGAKRNLKPLYFIKLYLSLKQPIHSKNYYFALFNLRRFRENAGNDLQLSDVLETS